MDSSWFPKGSGVLVSWTDSQSVEHLGVLTIRHFLDTNGTSGQCVQQGLWYAWFRGCQEPEPPNPPFMCACAEDDIFPVRITCFTLASGEFFNPDCLLVGEIDPADIPCLSHIEPLPLVTPISLGCCRGRQAFIAGWGKTRPVGQCGGAETPARYLHVGNTQIESVGCTLSGRYSTVTIASGCTTQGSCMAYGLEHDSGGAICVEMGDGSLAVVGITQTATGSVGAVSHQYFTASGTQHLCHPCYARPISCGDMNGDDIEDCADLAILELLTPWQVTPWCPGDLDGDGCAGTSGDLKQIKCDPNDPNAFDPCFQTCRGDVNRDGFVNSADYDLIASFLGESESLPCPCQTCATAIESCPWDADYDGDVDLNDLSYALGNYQCSPTSPGCGISGPQCP